MSEHPVVRAVPAFGEFYRREYPAGTGLAYVLCRSRTTAEELTQEAFTAAFRRWGEVSQMDSPEGWVRKVVADRSVSVSAGSPPRAGLWFGWDGTTTHRQSVPT